MIKPMHSPALLPAVLLLCAVETVPLAYSQTPALQPNYGKLPLSFEANQGQTDSQVRFTSRGSGYSLFLTDKEAVLALTKGVKACHPAAISGGSPAIPALKPFQSGTDHRSPCHSSVEETDFIRLQLAGANPTLRISGEDHLPGTVNYFLGNHPENWHSNVPTYGKVKYTAVYPGVDLVYYGNQRQLEYDFVVAPGADPKQVQLHFAGATNLQLSSQGDLRVVAKNGEIAFHKPVVYQERDGQRELVKGQFSMLAGNTIGFSLGAYDQNRELVIDPTLSYSTYLGGSTYEEAFAVKADASGNAYITGTTYSADFPTKAPYQSKNRAAAAAGSNVFVTKVAPGGTSLVYSTYLGGSSADGDYGTAITLDTAGDAYLTGFTHSTDFPLKNAYQSVNKAAATGQSSPFVAKLNPSGSALIFSTFFGGSSSTDNSDGGDRGRGIAVDSSDYVYMTGDTYSSDFPVSANAYQKTNLALARDSSNAFIAKFSHTGEKLEYSTLLGGSGIVSSSSDPDRYYFGDGASSIALDTDGNTYLTGIASSTDFPVTKGAYQTTNRAAANRASNAFVTKLNATGTALVYSTYLGGSSVYDPSQTCLSCQNGDGGSGIAVDSNGNAYVSGGTYSQNFPTTKGAFQSKNHSTSKETSNAFVVKLNPSGSALVYSTLVGGNAPSGDVAYAMALDSSLNVYITGFTSSSNFPVISGAYQSKSTAVANGTTSAFLTEVNPTGTSLLYSTYLSGSGFDFENAEYIGDGAYGIALDTDNGVYLAGYAGSKNFPVSSGAFQTTNHSELFTAFVSKFAFGSAKAVELGSDEDSQSPDSTESSTGEDGEAAIAVIQTRPDNAIPAVKVGAGPPASPTFSPAPGTYSRAQVVAIADVATGGVIYYTTNGTKPTTASPRYSGPITIAATETLKAIDVYDGVNPSAVASGVYTIQ